MHVTALLAAAAFASSVHAWGTLGHQTVALLAQQYLLPETISSVQEILNDTTPIYMGRTALWADQYRLTPEGKFSAPFHFIDGRGTPPGTCGVTMSDCPEEGCAVSAIANYTLRLQDKSLDPLQRKQALWFIVHLIADIAQPLHTAGIDLGGNTITVTFKGYKTSMHAVWDTAIPNSILGLTPNASITYENSFGFASKLAAAINMGEYKECTCSWIEHYNVHSWQEIEDATLQWADDTNNWVCMYVLKDGDAAYNNTEVGGAYAVGAYPIVEEALARAGVRLSAWLNLIFAGETGF